MLSRIENIVSIASRPRTTNRIPGPFELEWPFPPPGWSLSQNAVHLWSACLDQPAHVVSALKSTLSSDEQTRAARFRFDQERERYAVGRGLLRKILGACIGIPSEAVRFQYGPQGKPALADNSNGAISFNVSHSGRLILIAVTRMGDIGVDVERICWLAEAESIAQRFFSPEEKAVFKNTPAGLKLKCFFKIWTRKEAILKCEGLGIAQIESALQTERSATFEQELIPADEYIGSIAATRTPSEVCAWQWPID